MPDHAHSPGAVFLSYAREDTEVAKRIAEAMRVLGVDVWFDRGELRGGDTWDARSKQIRECALFMPLISATTQARGEDDFRREWKFAAECAHGMAAGRIFMLPVAIDDTPESAVPEEFARQPLTRLAKGEPTPEFIAQVKRLMEGPKKPSLKPGLPRPPTLPPEFKQAARAKAAADTATQARKSGLPGWVWVVLVLVFVAVVAGLAMRS